MDDQHPDGFKESELETLGSLERDLPVELSFLIRQQAYCMARMNYLDRQIRELKESKQSNPIPSCSRTSTYNQLHSNNINNSHHHHHHQNQRIINNPNTSTAINSSNNAIVHTKNGNFIPSDDSGGEYSRATISDDDELSSLLDQIAKSVKPDQRNSINQNLNSNLQHQQLAHYSVISNQPQPYAIINPSQLHHHHHQAVPVFVMGSPITTAHPSSISSTILPGVHFQPEPRYNQYYEDFYVHNNNNNNNITSNNNSNSNNNNSTLNTLNTRQCGIGRSRQQQFDTSISAIEQLVSQKEKRQIKSQLRCADNWLKMRSSGLCNLSDFGASTGSSNSSNNNSATNNTSSIAANVNSNGSVIERNLPKSTSSSSATITMENKKSNSVIDSNCNRSR